MNCSYKKSFVTFMLASIACFAVKAPHAERVVEYATSHLPLYGTLKNEKGFIYLDIDDRYIHALVPLIAKLGFEAPPYFGGKGLVGAHISLIYAEEFEKYHLKEIKECGKKFAFTLKDCEVVYINSETRLKGAEELYYMIVNCDELKEVRHKYGLEASPYGLHITIGVKYPANHPLSDRVLHKAFRSQEDD